jgi:hypothetical protein
MICIWATAFCIPVSGGSAREGKLHVNNLDGNKTAPGDGYVSLDVRRRV